MADDKRNRGDQQQGGNQDRDRQRQKDRKPGGSMDSPAGGGRTRPEDDPEPQE
ncbi:MAG TPA: hypothetical protein VGL98_14645 [Gammaproteobacteria bacterium]